MVSISQFRARPALTTISPTRIVPNRAPPTMVTSRTCEVRPIESDATRTKQSIVSPSNMRSTAMVARAEAFFTRDLVDRT